MEPTISVCALPTLDGACTPGLRYHCGITTHCSPCWHKSRQAPNLSPRAVAVAGELQSELRPAPEQQHLVGELHVLLEERKHVLVREGTDLLAVAVTAETRRRQHTRRADRPQRRAQYKQPGEERKEINNYTCMETINRVR